MRTTFYHYEDKDISINIDAVLEDGELLFDGFDCGEQVKKLREVSDEYEYKLFLNQDNSSKLFEALGVADKTDKQKLAALIEKFGENGSISEIEEYCDDHEIKTEFYCWP
jgi:hypothetical protein